MQDTNLELRSNPKRSAKKQMQALIGVSPRYDIALMHIAAGSSQRVAASAAGVSQSKLCKLLQTVEGGKRLDFWLRQEIRALAPKAIRSLDAALGSRNAIASVRAAESLLDRSGLNNVGIDVGGDLVVTLNLGPSAVKPAIQLENDNAQPE